jgi:hypothetical protein
MLVNNVDCICIRPCHVFSFGFDFLRRCSQLRIARILRLVSGKCSPGHHYIDRRDLVIMLISHMPQQTACLIFDPNTTDHMSTVSFDAMKATSANYAESSLLPFASASSKRPKLSLNTRSLPSSFGQRTTSLRLETLSATSPTARNTLQNATSHMSQHPKSSKLSQPASRLVSKTAKQHSTTQTTELANPSPSTPSSESTADVPTPQLTSTLPYSIKSTLSDSPATRARTLKSSFAAPRSMFPAVKRVVFRSPLTEEITTTRFTMRHSDIDSSQSSISTLELPAVQESHEGSATDVKAPTEVPNRIGNAGSSSPRTGDKRDSSDEEDNESCLATPVAGRQKRHRQWVWTLSPVSGKPQDGDTRSRTEDPLEEDEIKTKKPHGYDS